MMSKIKVGIIGTGFTIGISSSHAAAYQKCDSTELTAVYDIIPGRAELFLKKHGIEGVKACDSLDELFSMVDAVSITTPNSEHVPLAIKAMEAGKHVLVEKPFSVNAFEAEKAVEVARKHPELVAMCCFNFREQPAAMYMKELLEAGVLGKIRFVRCHYGGGRIASGENVYLEWRLREETAGSGSLSDFGAHMLDISDWMLREQCGRFVSYTAATTTNVKERYVIDESSVTGEKLGDEKAPVTNDDTAQFSAITDQGVMFSFLTSRMNFSGMEYEVIGEKGFLSDGSKWPEGTLGVQLNGVALPGEEKPVAGMRAVPIPERIIKAGDPGVGHIGVVREFADCILSGKKPERDLERGLLIQKQIDRFVLAAKEGRTLYFED